MKKLLLVSLILVVATTAQAQTDYMELFRHDLNAEKVAILTDSLGLTEAQGEVFWPIYREYDVELAKISDGYVALIKKFAANYGQMTDEAATQIAEDSFKLDEDRTKLQKKYFKRVAKEVDPQTAASFIQIERLIGMLVRLQVASQLPLIKETTD